MNLKVLHIVLFMLVGILSGMHAVHAQVYNKEVRAKIIVERTSEFYTFKARAENLTPSDFSLRYDFMMFKEDANGNQSKSNQENRFFLQGNQIIVLAQAVVNYNVTDKIILVLLIYDQNDKPIGMDRIELAQGGRTQLKVIEEDSQENQLGQDQAAPQDGFVLGGFIFNEAITKAGRDFYRYFFNDFNNRNIQTKKNITIKEVPGRGRSTRVSVLVENRLVWQFFSQARKEFLQDMAQESLKRVIRELQRLERQKNQIINY